MEEQATDPKRRTLFQRIVSMTGPAALGGLVLNRLFGRGVVAVRAADGDALIIGAFNTGSSMTTLTSSPSGVSGIPAFDVENPGFDVAAIQGTVTTTTGPSKGVVGRADSGNGVGIFGFNTAEAG